jgi:predicted outer membrane repeat protein
MTVSACTFSANAGGGITSEDYQYIFTGQDPFVAATMTVSNCTFSNNTGGAGLVNDTSYQGTISVTGCTMSGNAFAGLSTSNGTMTVTNCNLIGNSGAGIENSGTMTVSDCTISGNNSPGYSNIGGGIYNDGMMTVTSCTISNNSTYLHGGGGIYNFTFGDMNFPGTMTVSGCTISGNSALYTGNGGLGGGIYNQGGTIAVIGCPLNANSAYDGGGIYNSLSGAGGQPSGSMTVSDSTLAGNTASFQGGAIYSLAPITLTPVTMTGCTLTGNSATFGGGIYGGWITANGCTLSGNSAFAGGGIDHQFGGEITLSGCTLTGNSAYLNAGYPNASGIGGGIYSASAMLISGCTLSGNSADVAGGGIFNDYGPYAPGTLTLENQSGIANNHAPAGADLENYGVASVSDSTIGNLDNQNSNAGAVTFYASTTSLAQAAADTISQVTAPLSNVYDADGNLIGVVPVPVTITLNLGQGSYGDLVNLHTQANVTLVIVGSGTVGTVNGTTVVGNSPAVTITGGNVRLVNLTLTTATDSPTVLVSGGLLTLRNDIVQESTGFNDAAIKITGGSLDLGTAAGPGGNTINVNGAGQSVVSTGPNIVTAVGNTFQVNGVAASSPVVTVAISSSVNPSLLNQPVTFTATVSAPGTGAASPSGSVTFVDKTTATTLGVVALSGGTASLTAPVSAVNAQIIAAVYSGDANYITSAAMVVQQVHYHFNGFLAPLNSSMSIALGRTVPIKFQLTDYNGAFISSPSAIQSLVITGPSGTITLTGSLRYDPTSNQFIANWQTKGLSAGAYTITLVLNDGTLPFTKTIALTKGGSSAGLTTVVAGGTGTAPGGLLGGDITLYVDNTNGDLTADELARIQDAVTAADAVTEPYGVAVTEVTDPTLADVTLNMDTTSAVGGYAAGVLGCTTDAGQITIINGWNFYAGSDATQIGSAQYDFETVVEHELGHALGLGHSTDSTSVMYATLNTGSVNRSLKTADLNVADSDTTGACGLHAAVEVGQVSNPSFMIVGRIENPSHGDLGRDVFFALANDSELPLGSRQLPETGRSGEPSRTMSAPPVDALFASVSQQPIFAGAVEHDLENAQLDVPLFAEPDASDADASAEYIPADSMV